MLYDSKIALRHGSPFRLRVLRLVEGQAHLAEYPATHIARFRVGLAQLSPAARAPLTRSS
jgi:hypothetical protein